MSLCLPYSTTLVNLNSPSMKCTQKKQKQNQNFHNIKPKPSSISLLTIHKSQPHTKFQALETVINKIETFVKSGIEINDPQIFASLLETCFHLRAIDLGIKLHKLIPEKLLRKNVGVSSKLIRLYAATGLVERAHELFEQMPKRNSSAFSWNSLISGYAETGLYEDALALYFHMVEEGVEPDKHTFPRVLKACGGVGMIQVGEEVHRHLIRYGYVNDGFVLNALVDMYSKCGDIITARKIFNSIKEKDLVSWNSMIMGYLRHDLMGDALSVSRSMVQEGCKPDSVTLSVVLSSMSQYKIGTEIHGWALRQGIEWHLSISNSLIVFYGKLKKLDRVRWLFDSMPERDKVSWNSMISAHTKDRIVLEYFQLMVNSNVVPDGITFVALLSTCAHLGMVKEGEELFSMMREEYGICPIMEHYACMVNLYARAGLVDEAYDMIVNSMEFDAGPTVWGALLTGCYIHGNVFIGETAAGYLFDLEPDNEHNFELLMKIYQNAGRLEDAERVRIMMIERGLDL